MIKALACVLPFIGFAANAAEVRVSALQHNTSILGDDTTSGRENGYDLGLEVSSAGANRLGLFGKMSINTEGGTNFGAVGAEYRFGDKWHITPGAGFALHDGKVDGTATELKFGSRELFYARVDAGRRFGDWGLGFRVEHLSNGGIFGDSRKNNGLDNFGLVITRVLK